MHTFGELKLKILPQKHVLYLSSKLKLWGTSRERFFLNVLYKTLLAFTRCYREVSTKTKNYKTANFLVFQAHIW